MHMTAQTLMYNDIVQGTDAGISLFKSEQFCTFYHDSDNAVEVSSISIDGADSIHRWQHYFPNRYFSLAGFVKTLGLK